MDTTTERALLALGRDLAELKSIHQAIGAIGVRWRRCKPNTKLARQLAHKYDELHRKSGDLSDRIIHLLVMKST